MVINGKEYKLAYTVGASCDREEKNTKLMTPSRRIVELALIMNKAYNDREKFYNPNFVECILTREELLAQNADILPEIDAEIGEVFARDSKITVPISPVKKNKGAEQG